MKIETIIKQQYENLSEVQMKLLTGMRSSGGMWDSKFLAEYLKCSRSTAIKHVRVLVQRGLAVELKVGGHLYFRASERTEGYLTFQRLQTSHP